MALVLEAAGGGGRLADIDPRMRIVAVCLFAVVIVACRSVNGPLVGIGMALIALILTQAPIRATLKRMAAMDGFIIFMLIMLPFTVPGDALFTLFGFAASRQGLMQAIEIMLKANAVVLAGLTLIGTLSSVTLGHALYRLHVPVNLVHLLLFTVRYIDVLHDEYLRSRTAMEARGFRPGTNLHTMRTIGYLIGMMLVRALERSERILAAMSCRGFVGQFPMFDDFRLRPRDWLFGSLVVLGCALILTVEIM